MDQNDSIAPCRMVTHQDGRTSLLLVIDFKDRHDYFDKVFKDYSRENNGHGWNQVIQTLIPNDVKSTLLFDPEADMVSIVGCDTAVLLHIAQQIRQLLEDEAALRQAVAASELD